MLSCLVLSCVVLFCGRASSVLSCLIAFCFSLSCLFCLVLVLSCLGLSGIVFSYVFMSCLVLHLDFLSLGLYCQLSGNDFSYLLFGSRLLVSLRFTYKSEGGNTESCACLTVVLCCVVCVVLSCLVLFCPALSCFVVPVLSFLVGSFFLSFLVLSFLSCACFVLSGLVWHCLFLSFRALSCPASLLAFPGFVLSVVLSCQFCLVLAFFV